MGARGSRAVPYRKEDDSTGRTKRDGEGMDAGGQEGTGREGRRAGEEGERRGGGVGQRGDDTQSVARCREWTCADVPRDRTYERDVIGVSVPTRGTR